MPMFQSMLMISAYELAEMMNDKKLVAEMQENAVITCAFPIFISDTMYDSDDMNYDARISRWVIENCGLNETLIYVEVEA